MHFFYHKLQWTVSYGASDFSFSPVHFVVRAHIDLHSPFREINASCPPTLYFSLPTIFLVSLCSPLLVEQLMRNKPKAHQTLQEGQVSNSVAEFFQFILFQVACLKTNNRNKTLLCLLLLFNKTIERPFALIMPVTCILFI